MFECEFSKQQAIYFPGEIRRLLLENFTFP